MRNNEEIYHLAYYPTVPIHTVLMDIILSLHNNELKHTLSTRNNLGDFLILLIKITIYGEQEFTNVMVNYKH